MSNGKILLVAGASSDIGCALIRHTIGDFDAVLCHYGRSAAKIDCLKEEFRDKIVPLQANLDSPEDTIRVAAEIARCDLTPSHFVWRCSNFSVSPTPVTKSEILRFSEPEAVAPVPVG